LISGCPLPFRASEGQRLGPVPEIYHQLERPIEAHIFVAVTPRYARLKPLAPGLKVV
jgi:hypothetical protein